MYYPKKYYAYLETKQPTSYLKKLKFKLLTEALYTKQASYFDTKVLKLLDYFFDFELYFGIPRKEKCSVSFLDIGCGDGEIVYFLKKMGWDAFGFEIGNKKFKQRIYYANSLLQANFLKKRFDVIRLAHVLEHINNPQAYLAKIYKLLNKNGLLYLSLPNTNSINAKIFQKYWLGYDVPRHQINYNLLNLSRILKQNGFKINKYQYNTNMFTQSLSWFLESKFNFKISFHFAFYLFSLLFYRQDCLSLKLRKI